MRLTLRNLLAYRHGLLGPQEAEELARKIQESPFAKELLERIGEVVRRRSLEAPEVEDQRARLDPNTVAEYLDHVLPPERVPDFERICFESDDQLAEIASCHLILTKVLTEPVPISDASRQRMYELIAQGIAAATPTGGTTTTPPDAPSGSGVLPSYAQARPTRHAGLRPSGFQLVLRLVVTAFLGAVGMGLGVVGLLLLTGQLREDSAVMAFLRGRPPNAIRKSVADAGRSGAEIPPAQDIGPRVPAADGPPSSENGSFPRLEEPISGDKTPSEPGVLEDKLSGPDADLMREGAQVPKPGPPVAASSLDRITEGVAESSSRDEESSTARGATLQQPEGVLRQFKPGESAPTPADTPPPAQEAKGLSLEFDASSEVLLVFDEGSSEWRWVAPKSQLAAGPDYLAVPGFYPIVRLGGQLSIKLHGPSKLSFLLGASPNEIVLRVAFGRLVFHDVPERWVVCIAPPVDVRVVATSSGAHWAIEVYGKHCGPEVPLGAEPALARLYRVNGQVAVVPSSGEFLQLDEIAELTIQNSGAILDKPKTLPEWTSWEQRIDPVDKLARGVVVGELQKGKTPLVAFREFARNRREEVRFLAYRALHAVEDYDPLVESLGNREDSKRWKDIAKLLAQAYTGGSPAVEKITSAVGQRYGPDGTRMAQLVFNLATKLEASQYKELVDALQSSEMAIRVMALWRLGLDSGSDRGFRPLDDPRNQRSALRQWEDWVRGLSKSAGEPGMGIPPELIP